jgi:hypothetical protein
LSPLLYVGRTIGGGSEARFKKHGATR